MVVCALQYNEALRVDPDRVTELYVKLGESGAEEVVCRAMEELASQLSDLNEVQGFADPELLQAVARNIGELALRIGLTGLSRVALDVDYCLHFDDHAAIAATFARLMRVGEISLTAIWDLQDMSV